RSTEVLFGRSRLGSQSDALVPGGVFDFCAEGTQHRAGSQPARLFLPAPRIPSGRMSLLRQSGRRALEYANEDDLLRFFSAGPDWGANQTPLSNARVAGDPSASPPPNARWPKSTNARPSGSRAPTFCPTIAAPLPDSGQSPAP